MNAAKLQHCIDTCIACANECNHFVSEGLKQENIVLFARCISLARECSEVCYATARLLGMAGEHASLFCHACAEICEACTEECKKNSEHTSVDMKRLAEISRTCAEECRALVGVNA